MSKKKSLGMGYVIFLLCALTTFSSCSIGEKIWNGINAIVKYDLDHGYYTYYYPKGVISETEYDGVVAVLQEAVEKGEKGAQEELDEYKNSYLKHGALYLNVDSDYGIVDYNEDDNVSVDFRKEFNKLANEIAARYAAKNYSDYRVTVVDDFALRIEIPALKETGGLDAFENAKNTFDMFAETDELQVLLGESVVSDGEEGAAELIKEISLYTQYETACVRFKFTDAGKAVLDEFAYNLEASKNASSSVEEQNLVIQVGDVKIEVNSYDYFTKDYELRYPIAATSELDYVETCLILFNSALNNGGYDIEFSPISTSNVFFY